MIVTLLDLSAAFDTTDHSSSLLSRLESRVGLKANVLKMVSFIPE